LLKLFITIIKGFFPDFYELAFTELSKWFDKQ